MSPHDPGAVRVLLANLDQKLTEMLKIYTGSDSRSSFVLADADRASVALVDLDELDVKDVVRSLRRSHPRMAVIGIGGDESAAALVDRRLAKPLTLRALQSALGSVGRDVTPRTAGVESKFASAAVTSTRRRPPDWSAPPPSRGRRAPRWGSTPGGS